jgi:uncharacterized FlaG/YvyC family protein
MGVVEARDRAARRAGLKRSAPSSGRHDKLALIIPITGFGAYGPEDIMKIKLPTEKMPYSGENIPREALRLENLGSAAPEQPPPASEPQAEVVPELDKEDLKKALSQTAELLSIFDRELIFEVLEDVGVVQIQVIDANDGRVVRKIPADEVLKLIRAMKEKIDDRVDVLA